MLLGNGRVGKTQICRRLQDQEYDDTVPSTHGVKIGAAPLTTPRTPATLRIWDFGGQDIYQARMRCSEVARHFHAGLDTRVGGYSLP